MKFDRIMLAMVNIEELDFDTLSQEDISQILIEYKQLVISIARRYFLVGGTLDDIIQEGMIGLFSAITTYSKKQNCSFKTFATMCIERNILDAIRKASRQKNMPLNEFFEVTEDGKVKFSTSENETDRLIYIPSNEDSLEDEYINRHEINSLMQEISEKLSKLEKSVLLFYIDGVNIEDIAKTLNKPTKSIYNCIARIKQKLSYLKRT